MPLTIGALVLGIGLLVLYRLDRYLNRLEAAEREEASARRQLDTLRALNSSPPAPGTMRRRYADRPDKDAAA